MSIESSRTTGSNETRDCLPDEVHAAITILFRKVVRRFGKAAQKGKIVVRFQERT